MLEKWRAARKRLWSPAENPTNEPLFAFWRVKAVVMLISTPVLVLLPLLVVSYLTFHAGIIVSIGASLLALATASNAILEAARIRLVLQLGRWTGWKREPIWRTEHPARFWTRTAVHATFVAIYGAGAVFLTVSTAGWMTAR